MADLPLAQNNSTDAILTEATATETSPDRPTVDVSIVVPTCNRPDALRRCLQYLFAQETTHRYEVVVVDNQPGQWDSAAVMADFPSAMLCQEPRPGSSYARNLGILQSQGRFIVTIDDDVVVPPDWLNQLLRPFDRPEVWVVTGNLLPLSLELETERLFESYCGLSQGEESFEVTGDWFKQSKQAVCGWEFGVTANAAYRVELFRPSQAGLLEETLGAGNPVGGGEDPYLFYRALRAGHTLVYWPAAYAWHEHRQTEAALTRQLYSYSKSASAYHLTTLIKDGDTRAVRELLMNLPLYYSKRLLLSVLGRSDYPVHLAYTEWAGYWAGPWSLWMAYRRIGQLGRSQPLAEGRPSLEVDASPESLSSGSPSPGLPSLGSQSDSI